MGRRSYALYLWHWPVIAIVNETNFGLTGLSLGALRAVLIVTLTLASYHFIENRARFSSSSTLAFTIRIGISMLLVVVLALMPASLSKQFFDGVASVAPNPGSNSPSTDSAFVPLPVPGGKTVLVVGDSWAHNLAVGMADPQFKTTIVNLGVGGCGLANPDFYRKDTGEEYRPPAECQNWATDWTGALQAKKPDAVVLYTGNWDQKEAKIGQEWVYPGDDVFDQLYAKRLDEALQLLLSSGVPVYLGTTIPLNDTPFRERSLAMNNLLLEAAKRNTGTKVLDFGTFLCRDGESGNCPQIRDKEPIYDATGHLAPYWQLKAAQWSLGQIYSEIEPASAKSSAAPSS